MADTTFVQNVITVPNKAAKIPARKGSARARRWAILLTLSGQTVGAYYKACRDAGIPCTKNNPLRARDMGLVTLAPPK
jgi:hypothetical protein|tara:strand:+ start:8017 stop:8250 length:234 start_codon:yes stop_codon:yes gene_type:complete